MTAPKPLPSWWPAACHKKYGLSKVRPPGMPKPAPKWCLEEWAAFDRWNAWLDAGRPKPRPKDVWARVPDWENASGTTYTPWTLRGEIKLKERPKPPKPKPPAPTLVKVPAVFLEKGVMSAWAPVAGPGPSDIAAWAVQCAARRVTFQWNAENVGLLAPYLAAAKKAGLAAGIWEQMENTHRTADQVAKTLRDHDAAYAIITVEGDWSAFDPRRLRELMGVDYPLALLTTWVGMNEVEKSVSWIAAGYTCMTEAYTNQASFITPGTCDRMAYWRGWPPWKCIDKTQEAEEGYLHTIPVIGLYWGAEFALYKNALKVWGDAFDAYLIETMTDQNRVDMAAA